MKSYFLVIVLLQHLKLIVAVEINSGLYELEKSIQAPVSQVDSKLGGLADILISLYFICLDLKMFLDGMLKFSTFYFKEMIFIKNTK